MGGDGLSNTLYTNSGGPSRGEDQGVNGGGGGGDPLTGLAAAAAASVASDTTALGGMVESPLHGLTGLGMGMDPGDLLVEFMMQAARQQ